MPRIVELLSGSIRQAALAGRAVRLKACTEQNKARSCIIYYYRVTVMNNKRQLLADFVLILGHSLRMTQAIRDILLKSVGFDPLLLFQHLAPQSSTLSHSAILKLLVQCQIDIDSDRLLSMLIHKGVVQMSLQKFLQFVLPCKVSALKSLNRQIKEPLKPSVSQQILYAFATLIKTETECVQQLQKGRRKMDQAGIRESQLVRFGKDLLDKSGHITAIKLKEFIKKVRPQANQLVVMSGIKFIFSECQKKIQLQDFVSILFKEEKCIEHHSLTPQELACHIVSWLLTHQQLIQFSLQQQAKENVGIQSVWKFISMDDPAQTSEVLDNTVCSLELKDLIQSFLAGSNRNSFQSKLKPHFQRNGRKVGEMSQQIISKGLVLLGQQLRFFKSLRDRFSRNAQLLRKAFRVIARGNQQITLQNFMQFSGENNFYPGQQETIGLLAQFDRREVGVVFEEDWLSVLLG